MKLAFARRLNPLKSTSEQTKLIELQTFTNNTPETLSSHFVVVVVFSTILQIDYKYHISIFDLANRFRHFNSFVFIECQNCIIEYEFRIY